MSTTNFDKFREKMEQSKAKKTSTPNQINWMKLDAGKRYTLRFLPLKSENMELPFSIFWHHALTFPDGHFESIACPNRINGEECPFCKLATAQYKNFVSTEDISYKDAFKKLVVKNHYLLVGFEPKELDVANITANDVKVVRASSKNNMELIESKLAKEIDFIDFSTGRHVELYKSKSKGTGKGGDITTITWDFEDPTIAISGSKGREAFDQLIELSPDLTSIITPLSPSKLQEKFAEFTKQPVSKDEEVEEVVAPKIDMAVTKKSVVTKSAEVPFDIEEMQKLMEEDN